MNKTDASQSVMTILNVLTCVFDVNLVKDPTNSILNWKTLLKEPDSSHHYKYNKYSFYYL